jgi:hypothetical protein
MRFRSTFAVALFAAAAATASAQQAPQGGARIAGTVKSVTASDVVLTTATGDVDVAVTPQTHVLVRQSASVSDIKPGAYLGTSNQNSADGTSGTATEVHLMDDGPNANYAMNNSGLTMTNGHVKSVTQTANGQEMDIDSGQATTRHVVVSADTSISKLGDVGIAGLKPGLEISAVTSPGTDGKPMATYISVRTSAAKPKP